MKCKLILFLFSIYKLVESHLHLNPPNYAFDHSLYEEVLDEELCHQQLVYIANNTMLMLQFLDAGIRTPRGILTGNFIDLGNYYQCLNINEELQHTTLEGKYCMINVPLEQENLQIPSLPGIPEWLQFPWPELSHNTSHFDEEMLTYKKEYNLRRALAETAIGSERGVSSDLAANLIFRLATCIPKPCTTKQALDVLLFNSSSIGLEYEEDFCRLPNDKPWVPGDYVAVVLFSFLGLLTLLSTCYDLHYTVLQRDSKQANKMFQSFSVYTNSRRVLTFTKNPGALECLDGIRAIAMMWVVIGHVFSSNMMTLVANQLDVLTWFTLFRSLWISSAPITVDTFFMLSGLLVVYTTAGKLTKMKLLKNIHLFYLNRYLRMFPVLAVAVLLQASLFNHMTDGPYWQPVANDVQNCRTYWWSTLLYVQNYINPFNMCLDHCWYLAVDMQLHILSPIVLFWMFDKRRTGWYAVTAALLVSLAASTIYNFINNFPSSIFSLTRIHEVIQYSQKYYFNTLTRASPFFVGMFYGYMLHLSRGKEVHIAKIHVAIIWICAVILSTSVIYSTYPITQMDWDNQLIDNFINSFMRPTWALAVGWMVFACVHGYGGPINWFLSLSLWKLPARLSYAIYIFHFPLIFLVQSTNLVPTYFMVEYDIIRFLSIFTLTFIVAFLVTLLVDAPFSTLIKLALSGGEKRKQPERTQDQIERQKEESENKLP